MMEKTAIELAAHISVSLIFTVVYNYIFTVQLIVAVFLFCNKLPKRNKFWLKLLIYIAVICIISSFWESDLGKEYPIWLIILRYFLVFGCATFGIILMYKCTVLQAILCGASAYSLQNFMYRIQLIIVAFIDETEFLYLQLIIRAIVWAVIYIMAYALFIRNKVQPDATTCRKNLHVIVICLLVVCTALVISSLLDKFGEPGIMYTICSIYAIISCICIFVVIYWLFTNDALKSDNQILERMLKLKGEQLAISKETIDIINIKCHDMKHQIGKLRSQVDAVVLDELEKNIKIYDSSIQTGNAALDILLSEKGLLCTGKGIRLTCNADGSKLNEMDDADVYSLFGNALDNAIKAVENLSQDKRIISVSIKEALGLVSIHIENYFQGDLTFLDGLPRTTQKDNNYHGFGMKSISHIVEKYAGYMSIDSSNNIFRLNISLTFNK